MDKSTVEAKREEFLLRALYVRNTRSEASMLLQKAQQLADKLTTDFSDFATQAKIDNTEIVGPNSVVKDQQALDDVRGIGYQMYKILDDG